MEGRLTRSKARLLNRLSQPPGLDVRIEEDNSGNDDSIIVLDDEEDNQMNDVEEEETSSAAAIPVEDPVDDEPIVDETIVDVDETGSTTIAGREDNNANEETIDVDLEEYRSEAGNVGSTTTTTTRVDSSTEQVPLPVMVIDSLEDSSITSITSITFTPDRRPGTSANNVTIDLDSEPNRFQTLDDSIDTTVRRANHVTRLSTDDTIDLEADEGTSVIDVEPRAPRDGPSSVVVLDRVRRDAHDVIDLTKSPVPSNNNITGVPKDPQPAASSSTSSSPGLSCSVCLDSYHEMKKIGEDIVSTICGHVFCGSCLDSALKKAGQRCPICRTILSGKKSWHKLFI